MKCCKCQKEIDFGMRGMCPPCYKANNTPAQGDPVSQVMDAISTELVKDPERLTRVPTCNWKQCNDWDESSVWHADCGAVWRLEDAGPKGHGMNFCPGCGKQLNEVLFVRGPEEDEE